MKSTVHPDVKGRASVQRHFLFDCEWMHSFILFGLLKKKFDILRNRQPTVVCNCFSFLLQLKNGSSGSFLSFFFY